MAEDLIVNSKSILETPDVLDRVSPVSSISPVEQDRKHPVDEERSVLQLPRDRPKTPTTIYQPAYHEFSICDRIVASIRNHPQLGSIDARSLLLATFETVLYRYTQQETIPVGVTIPSRGIDRTYTKELYTAIDGDLSSRELISHLSTVLGTIIQDELQQSSEPDLANQFHSRSHLPIVVTILQSDHLNQWLTALQQQPHESNDNLDLHLVILQTQQEIAGILEYNANLFEPDTIQRLLGHFQIVLEGILADLDCPIAQLPLLTEAEQHQLLVDWRSASVQYPQVAIHQHIADFAIQTPDAIALRFKQQHLTYAELNQRVNQLAHYLLQVGVGAEVRVAACLQPSLEAVIGLLAILKAGGVYVPLSSNHPKDRLAMILEDTQAKVLLTEMQLKPSLPDTAEYTLCLDSEWDTIRPFPTHNPVNAIDLDQTAYIIYTSGTTGKPKGVMASQRNLINYILATQERLGFNHNDVMPAIARFTFSISMFELLSPLAAGGTLVILEREHILDFGRMAQTLEQLTMLHTVPSLMQQLVAYIQDKGLDCQKFQGVKHIFTGGDTVPPDLLDRLKQVFPNASVAVLYGCSEVSSLCATYPVARDQQITKSRVGKPFNNVIIRLYDPHQNLVPIGIPGEIYIGGAGVTSGYLNRDDLTQEKFVTIDGQKFYRTGDLGRFGSDGNLEFLGRADFQIKLRGIRIELGDIESTLRQIPGVREGIVVARELGNQEKSLVAYLVLDQAQPPAIADIRRVLQVKLPDYMVPVAFVVLDAMPLNPNQKIDRRALPMPTLSDLTGGTAIVPARNKVEQQLVKLWEALLGIQPIGVQNNFFELGGNSLLAVSLMLQIKQVFGQDLPLSTLVTAPTIEAMAELLSQSEDTAASDSLVLLKEGGSAPPIFFIHEFDGEILLYRTLAYLLNPEHPVYAIQPLSRKNHPILHSRIPDMAAYYIGKIRSVQPEGPYFLSGLCAGGMLAFEIACQLQRQGQTVAMVGIIDAADVDAVPRPSSLARERLNSFSHALRQEKQGNLRDSFFQIAWKATQKLSNLVAYEIQTRIKETQDTVKMRLFRYFLDWGLALPPFLRHIRARAIFMFAIKDYAPQDVYQGEIILFRATDRTADDEPCISIYSDPLLGWGKRASEPVLAYDIPGGHASVLQSPNVEVIAEHMQAYITTALYRYPATSNSARVDASVM
jgi:amino acid adenylation domain-containing protein